MLATGHFARHSFCQHFIHIFLPDPENQSKIMQKKYVCPVLKELTDDGREMCSDFSSLPCRDMSITMEDQKGELAGQQW